MSNGPDDEEKYPDYPDTRTEQEVELSNESSHVEEEFYKEDPNQC